MSDRVPGTSDPTLTAAIRALARGGDPDLGLTSLLEAARAVGGATRAAALLWDGPAAALRVAGGVGLADGDDAAYDSAAADRAGAIAAAAHDRRPILDGRDPVHAGSVLWAWPVVVVGDGVDEPIGSLILSRPEPATIDPVDAERVAAIADLVGLLVDRARLVANAEERGDWLERVANSDGLTGLANARTLSRVVELEVARASRQQSELCLAIFDVDGLARINDRAGRAVGDAILREVAAVIAESVRLVDTVARQGADEFVLVAPGAKGPSVIRRIVGAVAARPPIGDVSFTVSAGVARFPADGTTEAELLAAAQAALTGARRQGPGTVAETSGGAASQPASS
ncbi:MAG TPA: GGDEF domain-containing protein [Candidatus Limnocylindrales bacterium]|nr:GGDEF domain-containing protein [Candidatus Limnocylindrales bacterium]